MSILLKSIYIIFIIIFSIVFAKPIFEYKGKVIKVYDGDTVWIQNGNKIDKVRIIGIDSPEIPNKFIGIKNYKFYGCGYEAKYFTKKLLEGKTVYIYYDSKSKKIDKYGRYLRYIFIKIKYKGKYYKIPFGALSILKGYSKVYPYEKFYFKKLYYKLENKAKSKKIGIWSSKCVQQDKKIKNYLIKQKTNNNKQNIKINLLNKKSFNKLSCGLTYTTKNCRIKGNINKYGEKIYHLPGWKYYPYTKINPSKGERWFCSEIEAIKCGWRASRVK